MYDYFRNMVMEKNISLEVASIAYDIWVELTTCYFCNFQLPEPSCCIGPDGQMLMCWDNEEHHFEIEILSKYNVEWFYRNRITEQIDGEELKSGCGGEITKILELFEKTVQS